MGRSADAGAPGLLDNGLTPADRQATGGSDGIPDEKETVMILATTTVEDVDRFLKVFATKGADKRAQHGSKGSTVFRDPTEANRVWALFEWDEQGWAAFVSDPEVPPILKEAGHLGKPDSAALLGKYGA
jgi:hypothetical protein